jgi:hypothetical protein
VALAVSRSLVNITINVLQGSAYAAVVALRAVDKIAARGVKVVVSAAVDFGSDDGGVGGDGGDDWRSGGGASPRSRREAAAARKDAEDLLRDALRGGGCSSGRGSGGRGEGGLLALLQDAAAEKRWGSGALAKILRLQIKYSASSAEGGSLQEEFRLGPAALRHKVNARASARVY